MMANQNQESEAVSVTDLAYNFPNAQGSALRGMDLHLPRGSRCLLIGANGAGKEFSHF